MEKKEENKKMVYGFHGEKYMSPKEMFASLPQKDKSEFRDQYIQRTGMSYPGFYNKLNRNSFKPLELVSFKEMITKYNS